VKMVADGEYMSQNWLFTDVVVKDTTETKMGEMDNIISFSFTNLF